LFNVLLGGLADYTTDERGDVGSWIRIACLSGLVSVISLLHSLGGATLESCLPSDSYHSAVGGILKQGVERLDNVRQEAGTQLRKLLRLELPRGVIGGEKWIIEGRDIVVQLYDE
jgi:tubulin-specific chaperone D